MLKLEPTLKAPFVWFGGKSRVADLIWRRLSFVDNYVEPFAGSLAVLLRRPRGWSGVETVNDLDCQVANVWRALTLNPEAVAHWCNWPVSEVDLHARHRWLVLSEDAVRFRERMRADPEYHDPKVAGWWLWGINQWIGGGWCREPEKDQRPTLHAGQATTKQHNHQQHHKRPIIGGTNPGSNGKGVHSHGHLSQQLPDLSGESGASGRGTHARGRPQLADTFDVGRGVHSHGTLTTMSARLAWLLDWFRAIQDRLRLVRICCGHWLRVCDSPSVTTRLGRTGLFLDPPYAKSIPRLQAWIRHLDGEGPEPKATRAASSRSGDLYATDHHDVDRLVAEVHRYCRERGTNPEYRIALAGYAGEHDALEAAGWEVVEWQTSGGYGNQGKSKGGGRGKENAGRERLWFSPHCNRERTLFDLVQSDPAPHEELSTEEPS